MSTALPALDPLSTVNAANLAETCSRCHSEIHASFKNHPHERERIATVDRAADPINKTRRIRPVVLTASNFASELKSSDLPILVDFWAPWCEPCKRLVPVLDELATELNGRVRIARIDIEAYPEIGASYRVNKLPTLIVFQKGRTVVRIIGAQSKNALLQPLSKYR